MWRENTENRKWERGGGTRVIDALVLPEAISARRQKARRRFALAPRVGYIFKAWLSSTSFFYSDIIFKLCLRRVTLIFEILHYINICRFRWLNQLTDFYLCFSPKSCQRCACKSCLISGCESVLENSRIDTRNHQEVHSVLHVQQFHGLLNEFPFSPKPNKNVHIKLLSWNLKQLC